MTCSVNSQWHGIIKLQSSFIIVISCTLEKNTRCVVREEMLWCSIKVSQSASLPILILELHQFSKRLWPFILRSLCQVLLFSQLCSVHWLNGTAPEKARLLSVECFKRCGGRYSKNSRSRCRINVRSISPTMRSRRRSWPSFTIGSTFGHVAYVANLFTENPIQARSSPCPAPNCKQTAHSFPKLSTNNCYQFL